MSSIVNYDKFDDYRHPTIEEFIKGFKYEYVNLVITNPSIKNNISFKESIYYWNQAEVGSAWDLSLDRIKQMLSMGTIRVPNKNSLVIVNVKNPIHNIKKGIYITPYWEYLLNSKNNIEYINMYSKNYQNMKLFYYQLGKCDIKYHDNGNIKVSESSYMSSIIPSPRFIIVKADSAKEGFEKIIKTYLTIDSSNKNETNHMIKALHQILTINDVLGYKLISGGKEMIIPDMNYDSIPFDSPYNYVTDKKDVLILDEKSSIIEKMLTEMHPDLKEFEKLKNQLELNNAGKMKATKNIESQPKKKLLNFQSNIISNLKHLVSKYTKLRKHNKLPFDISIEEYIESQKSKVTKYIENNTNIPTIIVTEKKQNFDYKNPESKWIPHTKVKKTLSYEELQNPLRLVYVATKTKDEVKKVQANLVDELIKEDPSWEVVCKSEGKRIKRRQDEIKGNPFTQSSSGSQKLLKKHKVNNKTISVINKQKITNPKKIKLKQFEKIIIPLLPHQYYTKTIFIPNEKGNFIKDKIEIKEYVKYKAI